MAGTPTEEEPLRATRAIVDLDAIAGNLRALKGLLPEQTRVMAVVKGNGYGHGAPWIARAALDAGASLLGVATVDEGSELRDAGIDAPTMILGSIDPIEAQRACRLGLEVSVADERLLRAVQDAARAPGMSGPIPVHLKVDTGLRRYGVLPDEAVDLALAIARDPLLRFASAFTHFASADQPQEPFTATQLERFAQAIEAMRSAGAPPEARHVANSAGILGGWSGDCEIARAGISLYGVPPSEEMSLPPGMRQAFRLESRVMRVIPIAAGDSVGYNRAFIAERPTSAMLIPIGYGDGYRRALAGTSWVGIEGRKAPLLGRVSMDQIVAEVPEGLTVRPGHRVVLAADDPASGAPSIHDLAGMMGTNAYETLVGFRRRIPRVYLRGGEYLPAGSWGEPGTDDG
ncbi:MAG: alanine racemase [Thermomicrobiales bacterium]|nr:alanine racemase [Thermomicrobiales bacterium]